ncbi:MAG: hypothetical protein JO264_06745 [Acidisphaera sp.]|nr:hypothetical protein [Acidisphaera sp.]
MSGFARLIAGAVRNDRRRRPFLVCRLAIGQASRVGAPACRLVRALWRERRASTFLITALVAPVVVGFTGMAVDAGIWYCEYSRLQLAADAAALGASRLLGDSSATTADYQNAAYVEASGITGGNLIGHLVTPITVVPAANKLSVSVTVQSTADTFFSAIFKIGRPAMATTATAGLNGSATGCVLALDKTAANAIDVDNSGSITGSGCGIFSNSTATNSIYLNSGTVSGKTVGTVGGISESSSGSNVLSPSPGNTNAAAETNPLASMTAPTPGSCNYTNYSATAWQSNPYSFTQSANVFCGNTTIGGNSTTDTFAPGIYYIVNGNLTFSNADITSASGVTFVLTGSTPGSLSWTNYSNTTSITAPTTGPTAGIAFWQTCPSAGGLAPANTLSGGGTLELSGDFYAPCGAVDANNNAQIIAAPSSSMSVIADTVYATGSAMIAASSTTSGSGSSGALALLQ